MFQRSLARRLAPAAITTTASILFFFAASLLAQDEAGELITDRPDQTESAAVIAPGSVQFEIGALFTREDGDGFDVDVFEVPGTLVRIGLVKDLELRVGWDGFITLDEGSEGIIDESGGGDANLGLKYRVRDEKGSAPEIALMVTGTVPVGDDLFTSDEVDPEFRLSLAHTLSDRLSLGYNLGIGWASGPGDDGETTTLSSFLYTVALGIGLTDRVGAFVELFGEIPGNAPGGPANSFDGGFTFLLRDNVQFDIAGGVGLSDAAADYFVGVGISFRLPR